MRILFDQGTPLPLRNCLKGHQVVAVYEKGLSELENGDLLAAAEFEFDLLITTDKNLRYQQNLQNRKIAILVLPTTAWPALKLKKVEIVRAVDRMSPGEYVQLE